MKKILILFFLLAACAPTAEYCKGMSYEEAVNIAKMSECGQGALKATHFCNEGTNTWWIDVNLKKEGCNPACVINTETKQAEINWRCTGLKRPE